MSFLLLQYVAIIWIASKILGQSCGNSMVHSPPNRSHDSTMLRHIEKMCLHGGLGWFGSLGFFEFLNLGNIYGILRKIWNSVKNETVGKYRRHI